MINGGNGGPIIIDRSHANTGGVAMKQVELVDTKLVVYSPLSHCTVWTPKTYIISFS
jgi:hypothetical protein